MLELLNLLTSVMNLGGTLGAALIVANSGVCLAHAGSDSVSGMSQPAGETTGLLRSRMRLVSGPMDRIPTDDDGLEDVILTFRKQYHLLRLLRLENEEAFLYVVLDRSQANLAMTRHKVAELERTLLEDRRRVRSMEERLRSEREKAERLAAATGDFDRDRRAAALPERELRDRTDRADAAEEFDLDELPAYLCEDSVRRMLGLSPAGMS